MLFTQKGKSERGGSKAELLAASKASRLARERLKIEASAAVKVQTAARGHLSRLLSNDARRTAFDKHLSDTERVLKMLQFQKIAESLPMAALLPMVCEFSSFYGSSLSIKNRTRSDCDRLHSLCNLCLPALAVKQPAVPPSSFSAVVKLTKACVLEAAQCINSSTDSAMLLLMTVLAMMDAYDSINTSTVTAKLAADQRCCSSLNTALKTWLELLQLDTEADATARQYDLLVLLLTLRLRCALHVASSTVPTTACTDLIKEVFGQPQLAITLGQRRLSSIVSTLQQSCLNSDWTQCSTALLSAAGVSVLQQPQQQCTSSSMAEKQTAAAAAVLSLTLAVRAATQRLSISDVSDDSLPRIAELFLQRALCWRRLHSAVMCTYDCSRCIAVAQAACSTVAEQSSDSSSKATDTNTTGSNISSQLLAKALHLRAQCALESGPQHSLAGAMRDLDAVVKLGSVLCGDAALRKQCKQQLNDLQRSEAVFAQRAAKQLRRSQQLARRASRADAAAAAQLAKASATTTAAADSDSAAAVQQPQRRRRARGGGRNPKDWVIPPSMKRTATAADAVRAQQVLASARERARSRAAAYQTAVAQAKAATATAADISAELAAAEFAEDTERMLQLQAQSRLMVARQLRHEAAVARRAAAVDGAAAAAATTAAGGSSSGAESDEYCGSSSGSSGDECDDSGDTTTAADDAEAAWLKEVSVIIDGADLLRAQSMQRSGSAAGLNVQSPLETAVLHYDLLAFNPQPRPPKALVVLPQVRCTSICCVVLRSMRNGVL
jgi:hypothetical protein